MSPFEKPIVFKPARIGLFFGVFTLLVIAGYSAYAAWPLLEGPSLEVLLSVTPSHTITLTGATSRVSILQVDGGGVPLGEDGSFSIERAMPPGYTAITVLAEDRFGRRTTKIIPFLNTF